MRFAVISDLHGNLAATEAVLADIDGLEKKVDVVVCAGDIVGHSSHPNEVIALLRERKIDAVRGNYDEVVAGRRAASGTDYPTSQDEAVDSRAIDWTKQELSAENVEYLTALPKELRIESSAFGRTSVQAVAPNEQIQEARRNLVAGWLFGGLLAKRQTPPSRPAPSRKRDQDGKDAADGKSDGRPAKPLRSVPRRVLIVHGSPRDTVEYLYPDTGHSVYRSIARHARADLVVHGHTHRSSQNVVDSVAFIGVGSVGRSPATGKAEYAVVETVGPDVDVDFRVIEYDASSEARDVERSGLPYELAERMRGGE